MFDTHTCRHAVLFIFVNQQGGVIPAAVAGSRGLAAARTNRIARRIRSTGPARATPSEMAAQPLRLLESRRSAGAPHHRCPAARRQAGF